MRKFASIALIALLLAGCNGGSDDDSKGANRDDPTASATPTPTGPPCADVWKAGETLPDDYDSCVLDGAAAPQEVYTCLDDTKLVAFDDQMYAVTGGTILQPKTQPFQDTPDYGKVFSDCTGEQ